MPDLNLVRGHTWTASALVCLAMFLFAQRRLHQKARVVGLRFRTTRRVRRNGAILRSLGEELASWRAEPACRLTRARPA
eukprot:1591810-Pyramimonas_sp.AAC.1